MFRFVATKFQKQNEGGYYYCLSSMTVSLSPDSFITLNGLHQVFCCGYEANMKKEGGRAVLLVTEYTNIVEIIRTPGCFVCELICFGVVSDKTFRTIYSYRESNSELFLDAIFELHIIDQQ